MSRTYDSWLEEHEPESFQDEPSYADPDDPFGDSSPSMMKQALKPKPKTIEARALAACGKKYFSSATQRREFKKLVPIGNTKEAMIQRLWVESCIEEVAKMNEGGTIKANFINLMRRIENESRRADNLYRLEKLYNEQVNSDKDTLKKELGLE